MVLIRIILISSYLFLYLFHISWIPHLKVLLRLWNFKPSALPDLTLNGYSIISLFRVWISEIWRPVRNLRSWALFLWYMSRNEGIWAPSTWKIGSFVISNVIFRSIYIVSIFCIFIIIKPKSALIPKRLSFLILDSLDIVPYYLSFFLNSSHVSILLFLLILIFDLSSHNFYSILH